MTRPATPGEAFTQVGSVGVPTLVRAGLSALLREQRCALHVREVELAALASATCDLLLWDPSLTDPSHDPTLERVRRAGTPVLLFTWEPTQETITRGKTVGAAGLLPPTLDLSAFVASVDAVIRRGAVPCRGGRSGSTTSRPRPADRLSKREREVLSHICAGSRNHDIAEELGLSINSVKTYVRSAYRKIGVERRAEAVIWGAQHGLVPKSVRGVRPAVPGTDS